QATYTYEPFGSVSASGLAGSNPYQYTSRENDNTGFYFYRARYYNPTLQRFVSEDPIEFYGRDVNLYAYTGNKPITYVYPIGYTAINRTIDGATPKVFRFPRLPVLFFIPLSVYEVYTRGTCVIPKRAAQATMAYYGGAVGSVIGADIGFVVGGLIMLFGGEIPGLAAGWVIGGTVVSAGAAYGTGIVIDAITPNGVCDMPAAAASKSSDIP